MILTSIHPGIRIDDVEKETGWPLRVAPELPETAPPSTAELRAVRKYDPKGVWTS
jgi:glutaconate CoA-transferase subunit B